MLVRSPLAMALVFPLAFILGVAAATATPPSSVDFALSARDASGAPLVLLYGTRLQRTVGARVEGLPGSAAQLRVRGKDSLVLALPPSTPPGTYQVSLEDRDGDFATLPVSVDTARDASSLATGTVSNARFSAFSDLADEGRIGTAPGTLAPGNHDHDDRYARKELSGAKVVLAADLSFTTPTSSPVPFDGTAFDPEGCHDPLVPCTLTCKRAGYYLVVAKIAIAEYAPNFDRALILRNGETVADESHVFATMSVKPGYTVTTVVALEVGDRIELVSTLPTDGNPSPRTRTLRGGAGGTELSMVRIAD